MLKEYDNLKEEIKNQFQSIYKTLLLYCLKCRKNTDSKNPKVTKTTNGRIMLWSKCAVCDSKKSKCIKEQEASGLLSSARIKTPWSKIPLVRALCFRGINS